MFTDAPVHMKAFFTFILRIWINSSHKIYEMVDIKSKTSLIRHIQKKIYHS